MRLLAFDTAAGGCSACVWEDGRVLAQAAETMAHGQAEALVPRLRAVMAEAGTAWESLDRIVVTVGPGSFTGLRVGLATARGLAVATGTPVVGITTLAVYAHALPAEQRGAGTVLAWVDSRRDDVFAQAFAAATLAPLCDPTAVTPDHVAAWLDSLGAPGPVVVAGDGLGEALPAMWSRPLPPGPPDVAVLAALGATAPLPAEPPSALYIRPPDAALPVNGGRLRP